jgi:hypothetical protein
MGARTIRAMVAILAFVVASCGRQPTPRREASPAQATQESPFHLISEDEIEVLRAQGLTDPVRQVVASLRAHPEVIPQPGVLGGRMWFPTDSDIWVLNARIVFARFEDGHIAGSGVFEFTVNADTSIAWRVLSSRIEGPPDDAPPN